MSNVCLLLSTLNSKVFVLAMETPHRHLLLPQSALDDLVATAGAAETLSSAVHSQATSAVHSAWLSNSCRFWAELAV